ncbi:MAG: hypothetical protein ACQEUZ_00505 [Pseudomonadota bacterium]
MRERDARQPPIGDYALIGDCRGAALVSRAGAIDWFAPLRFDGDPVFFRLLDAGRGGAWEIRAGEAPRITRAYLPRSNILRTRFETERGVLEVLDFMPVGRSREAGVHDYVSLAAPGWLVRHLECRSGEGERRNAVLTRLPPLRDPRRDADAAFETTRAFWEEWCEYSRYRGPYADAVQRSALALKLLTYAPTGALVAGPHHLAARDAGGRAQLGLSLLLDA